MPKLISTDTAPLAIGPYAQAVCTESLLFISGQLPVDPSTGTLIPGDVSAQTHQCLKNLSAIASAAGLSLKQAVKVTVFLTDMADFPSMNAVYSHYFGATLPARSTVQVAGLPKNAALEIEAILAY